MHCSGIFLSLRNYLERTVEKWGKIRKTNRRICGCSSNSGVCCYSERLAAALVKTWALSLFQSWKIWRQHESDAKSHGAPESDTRQSWTSAGSERFWWSWGFWVSDASGRTDQTDLWDSRWASACGHKPILTRLMRDEIWNHYDLYI